MVLGPRRLARSMYTPAQVAGFFFQPCRDEHDEVILEYHRCRSSTVRKQARRNGFSNLMSHVRSEHAGCNDRRDGVDHQLHPSLIPQPLPLARVDSEKQPTAVIL
ncbi:hypothetical protein PHYPSEUDO_007614 [Phytophthora pseudosyringae]|uniref:Uncharacterized protein n=1 Tax=Phytophthora pseudosyringae TaxID=221518 RepID=A0A8T1VJ81_9STRA|nr:hypothetical protein PHYPSEUDO_007614 [Phytophthora pseudosyringae]